jgi:hypothetical protein
MRRRAEARRQAVHDSADMTEPVSSVRSRPAANSKAPLE